MSQRPLSFYEFGPFRINVNERLLQRGEELVPLSPKVFDTLLILVENHGHVVEKRDLMELLWPETFVEESSLTQNISLLRRALTERTGERQYIETIPKRGYRFVGEVNHVDEANAATDFGRVPSITLDRDERFTTSTTTDLSDRRITRRTNLYVAAIAVVVLIGALATLGYRLRQRTTTNDGLAGKSIAVLPFKTIGTDSEKELLGLGMADALIMRLSRLEELSVLPTGSVFRYADRNVDAITVGKELGVEGVLDGTIQRQGEMVRVTAQLVRVSDGRTVWSMKYDERQSNIFTLQDSISQQLAVSLIPQISAKRKQSLWVKPANPDAYQSYLLGMHFWSRRTKENLAKAIQYLEDAVQKDPNFGQAHAILADCYFLGATDEYRTMSPDEATARAEASANRALQIDGTIGEAHTVKAGIFLMRRQYPEAGDEFRRALDLKPNYAVGHLRYAYYLMWTLRIEEAELHMRRAQQLDPVSPVTNAALGSVLLNARKLDESIKYSQRALELEPTLMAPRLNLADAYLEKEMFNEAIQEFDKVHADDDEYVISEKAYAYAVAGRRQESIKMFGALQKLVGSRGAPYAYARIYGALGETDKAFAWLEKINLGQMMQANLKYDAQIDSLRADTRFNDFLKRHGMEHLRSETK